MMRIVELILAVGLLLAVTIRDGFGVINGNHGIMILGSLLGVFYLIFNWWTNKPKETNLRTIIVSVLYSLTCWSFAFTLLFKLLYLSGSDEMMIMSAVLLIIAIGTDIITSINKFRVINKWLSWRLGILSLLIGILFAIPEDHRISITYKDYPDFIKYYLDNKSNEPFYILQEKYFYQNGQTQNKKQRSL